MRLWGIGIAVVTSVVLVTQAWPAFAQDPPSPVAASPALAAATMLHLGASATIQVSPDQLVAELVAQATAHGAAAAQLQVNALIAAGMKEAQAVDGVDARAIGYSVEPTDDKHAGWTVRQTLELRDRAGSSLLDLTGRLQERGFVTASLDWQLSDAARRRAHDAATIDALRQLQARAREAAAALGLLVDRFTDVRLEDVPEFRPRPGGPMLMAARMAEPPQATASAQDVSADVSADVLLRPQ